MVEDGAGRGRAFEQLVGRFLDLLVEVYPKTVEIRRQPRLRLHNSEVVIPDFELIYREPGRENRILLECQDRQRSSKEIVRKLHYIKGLSSSNRCMFVYRYASFLRQDNALKKALDQDGIQHRSLAQFANYLEGLSSTQFYITRPPFNQFSEELWQFASSEPGLGVKFLEEMTGGKAQEFSEMLRQFASSEPGLGKKFRKEMTGEPAREPVTDKAQLAKPTLPTIQDILFRRR